MPSSRIKIKSVVRVVDSIDTRTDTVSTRCDIVGGSAACHVVTGWEDTIIGRVVIAFAVLKQRLRVGQVALARIAKDVVEWVVAVNVENAKLLLAV